MQKKLEEADLPVVFKGHFSMNLLLNFPNQYLM